MSPARDVAEKKKLKAAFEELTHGRQWGYLLYFSSAKQPKTREGGSKNTSPQYLAAKVQPIENGSATKPFFRPHLAQGRATYLAGPILIAGLHKTLCPGNYALINVPYTKPINHGK